VSHLVVAANDTIAAQEKALKSWSRWGQKSRAESSVKRVFHSLL
jgi:hypothetical protein